MKYYKIHEFQGWYYNLNPVLKIKLDDLRDEWKTKIYISSAPGAVGRHLGPNNLSQHNIDKWPTVNAVDVLPNGLENVSDAYRFFKLAKKVGFTGIGFYPFWRPYPGFHLDVRATDIVATWGSIEVGEYVGIQTAFNAVT